MYEGPRQLHMREVEMPVIGEQDVLVKVSFAGICGSELSGYYGKNSLRVPPLIMGHEFSGVIADKGAAVDGLEIGDRVTANPLSSCQVCDDCQEARSHLCHERKLLGAHLPGAYADYVRVPASQTHKLPEGMSLEVAAMMEPLACAVHIVSQAELKGSDSLLIVGAGPIGLFTLLAAQKWGVKHIVVQEIAAERLKMVEALGGIAVSGEEELSRFMPDRGFTASVDAVGLEVTRRLCVQSTRPGGRVVFSGLHSADSSLPINEIIRNETVLKGAFAYTPDDFRQALQWDEAFGPKRLEPWLVEAPLKEGQFWFEKLTNDPGSVAKVLLRINN